MSSKSSIKAKLAAAKLPERTIELCLNGDLVAEHERAERELTQAEKTAVDSLAGSGYGAIVERIDALEEQMRESTQEFTVRALPHRRSPRDDRPTYRELIKAHPPRTGPDGKLVGDDEEMGFNADTLHEDLVRKCVVDPVLDDDDWGVLFSVLSEGQFALLSAAAHLINRNEISVPFSLAASRVKQATAAE